MGKDTEFDFGWNAKEFEQSPPWTEDEKPENKQENWLVEQTCEYVLKQIRLMTATVRKGNRTAMSISLEKYYNEKKAKSGNGFKRNPFLKPENIPARGLPFTVLALREAQGGFSDLLMDISAGKKEWTVGLKRDSVLLGQLCQQFGMKDARWPKQKGVFVLAKGKYINLQPSK